MTTPFDPNQHGAVTQLSDGRIQVAFHRNLDQSIDQVWQAITDPQDLAVWFPSLRFELLIGSEFQIWFDGNCVGPAHVTGLVEVIDSPTHLKLSTMNWVLRETRNGCSLTFSDILHFDEVRTKQQFAISVLGGWHAYVDTLGAYLNGTHSGENSPEPDYGEIAVPGWELLN